MCWVGQYSSQMRGFVFAGWEHFAPGSSSRASYLFDTEASVFHNCALPRVCLTVVPYGHNYKVSKDVSTLLLVIVSRLTFSDAPWGSSTGYEYTLPCFGWNKSLQVSSFVFTLVGFHVMEPRWDYPSLTNSSSSSYKLGQSTDDEAVSKTVPVLAEFN